MSDLKPFPKVPKNLDSIVKPEELVDIVEMTPLTLQDRRIYNLLLGAAWNKFFIEIEHTIAQSDLTKYVDSNNQDIASSLRRLMSAIVVIKIRHNNNGKPSTRQMQLLGENDIEDKGGTIKYSFPPKLISVIQNTKIFARLHTKVMFQLSSKYSLALYEFIQRRKDLKYKNYELRSIEEVRGLLGVGKNKLKSFGHLNDKAIKPAIKEVSFLTEIDIHAEPIRQGRSVTHVKFSWQKKHDIGAQIAAVEELERSRVGRNARMNNSVERITEYQPHLLSQESDFKVSPLAMEKAKEIVLNAGAGLDIYAIERDFLAYASQKGEKLKSVDGAFIGFVKKRVCKAP